MKVAAQPVEFGDDQGCPGVLAMLQRLCQFRPIILLAALNLHEFTQQLPVAAVQVPGDGRLLSLKAYPPTVPLFAEV